MEDFDCGCSLHDPGVAAGDGALQSKNVGGDPRPDAHAVRDGLRVVHTRLTLRALLKEVPPPHLLEFAGRSARPRVDLNNYNFRYSDLGGVKVVRVLSWQNETYHGVPVERVAAKLAEELAKVVVGVLERCEPPYRLAHVVGGYLLRGAHFLPFFLRDIRLPFLRVPERVPERRVPPPYSLPRR